MKTEDFLIELQCTNDPIAFNKIKSLLDNIILINSESPNKEFQLSNNIDQNKDWKRLMIKMNLLAITSNHSQSATRVLKFQYETLLLKTFSTKLIAPNRVYVKWMPKDQMYCMKNTAFNKAFRGYRALYNHFEAINHKIVFYDKDEILNNSFDKYPKSITYSEFVNRLNKLNNTLHYSEE